MTQMHTHTIWDIQKAFLGDVLFIKTNPVNNGEAAKLLCHTLVTLSGNKYILKGKFKNFKQIV